ncbi:MULTISPECIES: TspO/MBR family protein [Methanobacterium]|jgi:tryptophan-rich sensory protein|uniref:Tryptophan-rich sensory protein n=1 Tax=Methanobacterium veterum TaxID=408577 RepID=A0A9E5A251_9EURY|nr:MULTISPECIES: TspO/MBR family protein [Methanobacterium]MCZ3366680.1 tryptophan-rich sensory protein [Methanobacterium veterum]MCZ3374175.1 tryptophan-rich sensory protein [Methanobacterium veterum]
MESLKKSEILKLVVSILIPLIAGFIGSIATMSSIPTWYASIIKPDWAPPNWVFGPVWTTLFILMGIALFLVWRKGLWRRDVKIAVIIFAVQLVLNVLWSVIFFGLQSLLGGLIEIVFLWIAILATIIAFYRISKPAGILLLPYIIWVTIASYLTYTVYLLNI